MLSRGPALQGSWFWPGNCFIWVRALKKWFLFNFPLVVLNDRAKLVLCVSALHIHTNIQQGASHVAWCSLPVLSRSACTNPAYSGHSGGEMVGYAMLCLLWITYSCLSSPLLFVCLLLNLEGLDPVLTWEISIGVRGCKDDEVIAYKVFLCSVLNATLTCTLKNGLNGKSYVCVATRKMFLCGVFRLFNILYAPVMERVGPDPATHQLSLSLLIFKMGQ